ncbi:MAG: Xaa-Pro peptidase family protein [Nitrososphaerales archaeon]|nr:Xaa-Pro peptidase family protein [Nitrososphaerales archaeon]
MATKDVHVARLRRLTKELGRSGLDGAIVAPGPNMRYLTGVNSLLLERPFLLFVPADGTPNLVAPSLEAGPYKRCPVRLSVHEWTDSQGSSGAIKVAVRELRLRGRWGVEGRVPFLFLHRLQEHADLRAEDAEPVLQGLREVKDEAEARLMRRSARILSRACEEFPALIREGMTEQEIGRKASDAIFAQGATGILDLLVQSGARAADPHGLPSGKKVRRGESIIIDASSTFEGYYADITRAFCLGNSREVGSVYAEVLAAEERAIAAAKEGVEVGRVDAAARNHLENAGLGKYFTHRTGHGLGLEVHEAPYIVEGGKEKLRRNMFFTVEPGAYLTGKLGIRIEDDVTIDGGRAVEITDAPKEYGWWR